MSVEQQFQVALLPPQPSTATRPDGDGEGEAVQQQPPLDPTYVAEIDSKGLIVHTVSRNETPWSNKKTEEQGEEEKAVPPVFPSQLPPIEENRRPSPLPPVEAFELPPETAQTKTVEEAGEGGGGEEQNVPQTRVLSLSEAAAKKREDEAKVEAIAKEEQTKREYEAVQQQKTREAEQLQDSRAERWKFWSTMSKQVRLLTQRWLALVKEQTCAICDVALHTQGQGQQAYGGEEESRQEEREQVEATQSTTDYPWNADLANDDVDNEAVQRMKADCVKKVLNLRSIANRYERNDPWVLAPCRHAMHGHPCALSFFKTKQTQCPRCKVQSTSVVPAIELLFGNDDEELSQMEIAQRQWIRDTIQCPPPLLSTVTLGAEISSRNRLFSSTMAPPMPAYSRMGRNSLLETSSSSSATAAAAQKARPHLRDAMELAQQRLVQKYVLLEKLEQAVVGEQNADQFMLVAQRLEALAPERKERAHLWQLLEPPREHRANVERAVALVRASASIDDPRPLEWLARRGFIDRDTIASLSKSVNASWFASLPRAAQRVLLEQLAKTDGSYDEAWWKAITESGLQEPSSIRVLLLARKNAKKEGERWASEAERHGRFALAVEMRKWIFEQSE